MTSIKNQQAHRWVQEKKLSSEAYLYNLAGQSTFTVDEQGPITHPSA
jgi:hypothetical protein